MFKKIVSKLLNLFSVLVCLLAVVILLGVLTTRSGQVPSIGGYSMLRVLTASMEPAIPVDSLLIVHETPPEQIQPGDVISFYSPDPDLQGAVNTHRVTAVSEQDGSLRFTTQGDANAVSDEYPVSAEDMIGKVIFVSPWLGKLIRLIGNPLIYFPMIFIPLGLLVFFEIKNIISTSKQIMEEEDDP
ncbi:MAG: signal peptidase I [Firmicutes bacterium]|nr:signal peptidase I [Bacillota bacterium]